MNRHLALMLTAVGLVAGCHLSPRYNESWRQAVIKSAEAKSFWGSDPGWLQFTNQKDLIRRVRDRAYAYCLKRTVIDTQCASGQDDAIQASVIALMIAGDEAAMKNKETLGRKEHYVATNPAVASRVVSACWALYKEHGASDARVLSVCLGNLSDFSPLLQLPVP